MKQSKVWNRIAMLGLALAAFVPTSAQTQNLASTPAPSEAAAVAPAVVGPVHVQVGIKRSASLDMPMISQQPSPTRRDVAWMVIGGATVIVGSIVGGDAGTIIMVVGGVVGLTGLWRYLQYS
jgi:hypothetical protein